MEALQKAASLAARQKHVHWLRRRMVAEPWLQTVLYGNNLFVARCSFQSVNFFTRRYIVDGEQPPTTSVRSHSSAPSTQHLEHQHYRQHGAPIDLLQMENFLDETQFPVGSLTLEQFLQIEDALDCFASVLIDDATSTPPVLKLSRQSMEQSLRLYGRLIQEYESNNPQLVDAHEMVHWIDGNYPRSVKLLDGILAQWSKWWVQNNTNANNNNNDIYKPQAMLELVEHWRSGNPPLRLTDKTFGILIRAAVKAGDNPAQTAVFADHLLDIMLEESISTDNTMIRPSLLTLNAILNAWAKSGLPDATNRVDALVSAMEEQYEQGVMDSPPDCNSYLAQMRTWVRSGKKESAAKVQEILEQMKKSPFEESAPHTEAYRVAIHSWVHAKEPDAILRAYSLFVELVQLYLLEQNPNINIDGDLFSIIISKLAKERHCEKAEEIFQLLEELHRSTQNDQFQPTLQTLSGMVIAYSHSRKYESALKAESILLYMEELAAAQDALRNLPKRGYFVDVIRALLSSKLHDGVDRAEQVLLRMIDYHRAGAHNLLPDKAMFDQILVCWARANRRDSPQRAESLLEMMHKVSDEFQSTIPRPNEKSYFHVMTAWSRSQDADAGDRVERIFNKMLAQYNAGDLTMTPSTRHYTTIVNTWATSNHRDAPERAQSIFDVAMDLYNGGDNACQPDIMLYTSVMRAWSRVGAAKNVEFLFMEMFKPNNPNPSTTTFNVMLEAWLLSGHPEAQMKARFLLESMLEFTRDGTLDVPPDGFTFNSIIDIVTSGLPDDAPEQAEKYLNLLKASSILRDRRGHEKVFSCYVTTMAAWCERNNYQATARISALIDELVELCKTRQIPLPTRGEYIRFLATVAKSRVPEKADSAKALLKLSPGKHKISQELLAT